MNFKEIIIPITIIFLFSSCTPTAPTPTPTVVPTTLPTATPSPEPLTGIIFWDANGSGLQDETSFIIPEFDPEDPPYFFELLAANGTGLGNYTPGELVSVPEPPIPGIGVCLDEICTETAADGTFTLQPEKAQDTYYLKFSDPNTDDPTRAFRYINKWNGLVVIESYEMNGVMVPEQHLNDTKDIEITKTLSVSDNTQIGLMQGFLTYPFVLEQYPEPFIWNYFDIIGNRFFDNAEKNTYTKSRDGNIISYDGKYHREGGPTKSGVNDSHTGTDFTIPVGNWILSASPNSEVYYLHHGDDEELRVSNSFTLSGINYSNSYGHLNAQLVERSQKVPRGGILGVSGNTGIYAGGYEELHLDLSIMSNAGHKYIDIFRTIIELDPLPENYWGSEYSYWTVDNIPQYPLVEIIE